MRNSGEIIGLMDKLKDTSEYAQNIVNTVREPLVVLDDKFRLLSANRSFYSTFKVTPEVSENTLLFDIGNGQWEIPKLRELLEEVLPESTTIEDFEVEHDFPDIGQKTMLLNARRIQSKAGAAPMILLAIEDITERRRLEDKLQDASEYAQDIVSTVREPLVALDNKFRVISANRSFYSTFKVTTEMSENTLLFDLGNGQWEIPKLRELLEKVLPKSTTIEAFEVEHDFPDIGQKTMLLNARRIPKPPGEIQMILLAIEDITERKRLDDKLQETSEYAQNIIDTGREPRVVLDDKFRLLSANKSFYSTFKVTPEVSENTLLFDIGNGQWEIPKLRELLEEVLPESTTIEDFEVEHDFPDIGQKTMLLNARRIQSKAGAAPMILLAIEDITERRRLEDKLQDASEYAQDIVSTVREPLVALDDKFRVISANRSFYSTFKVTTEMSENTLLFDLGNGQWEIPKLRELLEKVLPKSTTIEDFEVEHDFPDIGQKTMLMNARRIQSKTGAAPMILLAIEDITERRSVENTLIRVNAEIEGFAHTVSHDLKGPLAAIMSANMILQDRVGKSLKGSALEELQYLMQIMNESVESSSMLIDDILALAEAGQEPRDLSDVEVAGIVDRILEERRTAIEDRGIRIKTDDDLGVVYVNPTHVYQVFTNLIGNAVNHCKSEAPVIEVSYLGEEDGSRRYLVRDNGEGIPPENLGKVFEPFFKGESGGTGIGLATVAKIIKLYGGEIRVYNDEGACFDFTINDMASTE